MKSGVGSKKGIIDDQNSCSTLAEELKYTTNENLYIIEDDTESLTANDFDVLNMENFYDKISDLGGQKQKATNTNKGNHHMKSEKHNKLALE